MGRLAVIAIIGKDDLTGSAWGDWALHSDSPLRALEDELGVQAPVVLQGPLVSGGIRGAISPVRAEGGYIRGTNGHSNGLVPMPRRNLNETAATWTGAGGGKRKGGPSRCT